MSHQYAGKDNTKDITKDNTKDITKDNSKYPNLKTKGNNSEIHLNKIFGKFFTACITKRCMQFDFSTPPTWLLVLSLAYCTPHDGGIAHDSGHAENLVSKSNQNENAAKPMDPYSESQTTTEPDREKVIGPTNPSETQRITHQQLQSSDYLAHAEPTPINSSEIPVKIIEQKNRLDKNSEAEKTRAAMSGTKSQENLLQEKNSDDSMATNNSIVQISNSQKSAVLNSSSLNSSSIKSDDSGTEVVITLAGNGIDEKETTEHAVNSESSKRKYGDQITKESLSEGVGVEINQMLNEALGLQGGAQDSRFPIKSEGYAELKGIKKDSEKDDKKLLSPVTDTVVGSKKNLKTSSFYHLSQGGYKKEIKEPSEIVLMDNHEEVMDFLKYVEVPHTQFNYSDWLKFDFQKEQVLAFLVKVPVKGMFVQMTGLSFDDSKQAVFDVNYETYEEDSSCSLTQWMSTAVSYHLVRIPRQNQLMRGVHAVRGRGSETKGCHGLLANFSQAEALNPLAAEVIWRGEMERPQKKVTLFQKNWDSWNQFTGKYCPECKRAESKYGFPDQQIAILVSSPGIGQLHLRKAYKSSGILFLDLERDDCQVEKNSIVLLLRKKDLGLSDSTLDLSKIAVTGPWIPRTKACKL